MTKDEFVDATIDLWDIPTESATRVGHPAPFPVELPRRLIELYTYRGDLVLDPFMGSGSTAVAAVRTERHFVGFDTDADYVALAERRVAEERAAWQRPRRAHPRRVTVAPARPADRTGEAGRATSPTRARRPAATRPARSPTSPGRPAGSPDIERGVAYGDLGRGRRLPGPGCGTAGSGCSSCAAPSRPPGPACAGPTCSGGRWARPPSSTRPAGATRPGRPRPAGPAHRPTAPAAARAGARRSTVAGRRRSGPSTTWSSSSTRTSIDAAAGRYGAGGRRDR